MFHYSCYSRPRQQQDAYKAGVSKNPDSGRPTANQWVGPQSPLSILWCFSSSLQTVFLTFFDSVIPGKQAFFTQHGLEQLVFFGKGPSDSVTNGSSLTTETPTIHLHCDREFAHRVGSLQRMLNHAAMLDPRESFLIGSIVDHNLSLTWEKSSLGDSTLALTCSPNVAFLAHKSSPFLQQRCAFFAWFMRRPLLRQHGEGETEPGEGAHLQDRPSVS